MTCKATLKYRGKLLVCTGDDSETFHFAHSCNGVHWGSEITERNQCDYSHVYCGETLRCQNDVDSKRPTCREHYAISSRFGAIKWSKEKRPQPAVMFDGLCMGHRYGSHQADCLMLAAATMQDAVNRMEYLRESAGCPVCR